MIVRLLIVAALAAAGAAGAAEPQSRSAKSAKAFTLDTVAPTPDPAAPAQPSPAASPEASPVLASPTVPDSAAVATPAAEPATAASAFRATFTLDTPIGDLLGNPAAKAVLDKDLPGLSTDDNLDKFVKLGLRQFQPLTGGQLTDAMLLKVARDLSSLSGPTLAPIAPGGSGNSKHNRDTSR